MYSATPSLWKSKKITCSFRALSLSGGSTNVMHNDDNLKMSAYELRGVKAQQLLVAIGDIAAHIVVFQEPRNKCGIYRAGYYCCYGAGADRQFLGCDVWASLIKPSVIRSSDGTCRHELVKNDERMRFVFGCPRSCCMSVSLPSVTLFVLCVHIPDKNKGCDTICVFVDDLCSNIKKFKVQTKNLALVGDLNHKFGSATSKVFGNCSPSVSLSPGHISTNNLMS